MNEDDKEIDSKQRFLNDDLTNDKKVNFIDQFNMTFLVEKKSK